MKAREMDRSGLVLAAGSAGLAVYVLWEAQRFSPLASVFPRFIAIVLIVAAAALTLLIFLGRQKPPKPGTGSNARRLALVVSMVAWLALVPVAGFLVASLLGFAAVGMVAKYDDWSVRRWLSFALATVISVGLFCFIFSQLLNVPLPKGLLPL
jgi:cobalamin synthase